MTRKILRELRAHLQHDAGGRWLMADGVNATYDIGSAGLFASTLESGGPVHSDWEEVDAGTQIHARLADLYAEAERLSARLALLDR